MKKTFKIKGMNCNSCAERIENALKNKAGIENVSVSFSNEKAEIYFDSEKISEKEIKEIIEETGYDIIDDDKKKEIKEVNKEPEIKEEYKETSEIPKKQKKNLSNTIGWFVLIGIILVLVFVLYYFVLRNINLEIPSVGDNGSLFLLFFVGILTGFHCISMCGGFVVSYTTKNALRGHKSFKQHLVYGGSKVVSYAIIGGLFGLIGGIFAFSVKLRGWVAIFAGIFMIFYALSMFGIKFFRKFQFNPKFLTRFTNKASSEAKGAYKGPFITGLLSGLFIACGPLQAMYLYAAGTGNLFSGASSLAAFGLGTLPVMLGFGSLATVISHKTTKRILKLSAIIVLILGLIMLNRGLALTGSSFNYDTIKAKIIGVSDTSESIINNGAQEVNMEVDASGYSPNSFVIKNKIPVKWNINVKQLTGCNNEIIMNDYNIDVKLKQGLNVIEFTPEKTGTISFSCWMGMIRGSFIVTDTGTASQQEIVAATPQSSGSCGCGG